MLGAGTVLGTERHSVLVAVVQNKEWNRLVVQSYLICQFRASVYLPYSLPLRPNYVPLFITHSKFYSERN